VPVEPERYELLDLLASGGMGEVYRARARGAHGFAKTVAVKRLRPELARDERFVERLVSEAQLLVSLQHSNLVSILDLGRAGDDVFLVLEYVDGPDLGQLLGAGPLPLDLAVQVVQAACDGVAFAHERPEGAVVHADLSPANVLVSRAGEVKVTDFGIARREGMLGHTGIIEGKWPYMSPEQARGEPLTGRSDVFSMGAVLYEALTGQPSFPGETAEEVRRAVLETDPRPPTQLRDGLPAPLEVVCLHALARRPEKRFGTMQKMASALREIAAQLGYRNDPAQLARLVAERAPPARSLAALRLLSELGIAPRAVKTMEPKPAWLGTTVHRERGGKGWRAQRRSRFLTPLLGAILLAGVGLGARRIAVPAPAPPAAIPPASAQIAPLPSTAAPPPAVAQLPVAPVTPAITPAAAPPLPVTSALRERPRAVRSARRARAPGTLRIFSEPWAELSVDGKSTGETTPIAELRLSPGSHRLRLANPVLQLERELDVNVLEGEIRVLQIQLAEGR